MLRGIGFWPSGSLVLVEPDAVLQLVLTALGVYLIYEGVTVLLRLVYRLPAPGEQRPPVSARVPLPGSRLTTGLLAAALIVAAVASFVGAGGTTTAAQATGPCNGHEALCDRQLDRVVLPATHDAMSAPTPGKFSSQQVGRSPTSSPTESTAS